MDISETIYAGYEYSFKIQGRDEYHNNISDYLADAVGNNYSIIYSLVSDSTVSVDAEIFDDSFSGVYVVKVSLPKKLKAGDFNLKILLRGAEPPSPAILVKPCTNMKAFKELGILQGAGNTNKLALNYTVSFPSKSIELPVV